MSSPNALRTEVSSIPVQDVERSRPHANPTSGATTSEREGKTGATPETSALSQAAIASPLAQRPAPAIEPHAPASEPGDSAFEPHRGPTVRVLSGPSSGRVVAFPGEQLTVGRVGVQVAVVRKVADGFRLVPVEGALPPRINGAAVEGDGSPLHPGDTFEVAGVRLELSVGS